MTLSCRLDTLWVSISELALLIDDTARIKNEERTLFMSPTADKNTVHPTKKQPQVDHKAANELTMKIVAQLRMAVRYAELAQDYEELFDNFGFDRSVEKFIQYAKDSSDTLKKLRKARGVTD